MLTVYSTCVAVKKKKTGIVKKFVPDLIRRTGDVQYLMTLITINISEGFF